MTTALRLDNFSYAWPGSRQWTLRGLDYELPRGECHCLTGASGSGKTTLSLALRGLLPPGRQAGHIHQPAAEEKTRAAVGLVLQNPETQILTDSIGAEVAFGLENLCIPPQEMPERVRDALAAVGLDLPFDHPTEHLSMGQKYRLLVAAQLVLNPGVLIIDEPAGQLDSDGLQSLASVISRLKIRGLAVLICEHRPGPLSETIDGYWHLDDTGQLQQGRSPHALFGDARAAATVQVVTEQQGLVVEASRLCVSKADATPAWQDANLCIRRGEVVRLSAVNGAGKTTLLRCLAGCLKPESGQVRVLGEPPTPRTLRGRAGFLFQNPRRQLFETTVFAEVAFSLRRSGFSTRKIEERVTETLECISISPLSRMSPHRLSYGQQHLVALAAVLSLRPQLLLLDDPLAGLDQKTSSLVMSVLASANREWGTSILWTSHQDHTPAGCAHRSLVIEGGQLVEHH